MNAIAASSSTNKIVARLERDSSLESRNGVFLTMFPSRQLSFRASTSSPRLAARVPGHQVADGVAAPTRGNGSPGCSLARGPGPHDSAWTRGVAAFARHPTLLLLHKAHGARPQACSRPWAPTKVTRPAPGSG